MSSQHRVHFDWARPGALAAAAAGYELGVVVDTLSFSTAVSVALDRGATAYPFRWQDDRADDRARELGATLAGPRRESGVSLSPAAIRAAPELTALLLPSPNGSTISCALPEKALTVLSGCLRNATAVAAFLSGQSADLVVIAAGERWPDGTLRPAVEDLWGAGAILQGVADRIGWAGFTPEARSAVAAFTGIADGLPNALAECTSGRELIDRGYASDVEIAAEFGSSNQVPVLRDSGFAPT